MPDDPGGHPLDRAIWNGLNTRRASFAVGTAVAKRLQPDVGLFVAAVDRSPASLAALAALVPPDGIAGMIEAVPWPTPPGCTILRQATLVQMVAPGATTPASGPVDSVALTDADAQAMLALATLTKPGPFFAGTHRLGGFIGVKYGDALIAMAGTRLALPGYVEISAVCTHPGHRGRGLAAALMTTLADTIRAGGDTPFLTSYADNAGAIALYERLGFRVRRELAFTTLGRG